MEGRCMKCSGQKKMNDIDMTKTSRGTFMAKGKCESCGTTICKICSKADGEALVSSGEAKKAY